MVVGGASKLNNYFIKTFNPKYILSYADRRYSNGNLYEKLNFKKCNATKPNYFYLNDKNENKMKRLNRFNFRKDILIKEGEDINLSEREIMINRGYNRIYDCGTLKFVYE